MFDVWGQEVTLLTVHRNSSINGFIDLSIHSNYYFAMDGNDESTMYQIFWTNAYGTSWVE